MSLAGLGLHRTAVGCLRCVVGGWRNATRQQRYSFCSHFPASTSSSAPQQSVVKDQTDKTGLFENELLQDVSGYATLNATVREACERLLAEILDVNRRRKTVLILDDLSNELCKAADLVECVRSLHADESIANAAERSMADFTDLVESLNTNTAVYDSVVRSRSTETLDETDRRILDLFIHDFEMSGIHLPENERREFVRLSSRIFELGAAFARAADQPVLVPHSRVPVEAGRLLGLHEGAAHDGRSMVVLDSPMSGADVAETRKWAHCAFFEHSDQQEDTLAQLVQARSEVSRLTGFASYFERAQRHTLLGSAENVERFLNDLISALRPTVERELALLQRCDGWHHRDVIGSWDLPYLTAKYRSQRYDFDRPACLAYLSLDGLLHGLNQLFKTLYDIELRTERSRPGEVWHDGVRKLAVYRNATGERKGVIYLDPTVREGKLGGDCHFTVRCSKQLPDGSYQLPIVVLSLGLIAEQNGQNATSAFVTTGQAENLCHEMGHAMHSVLGATRYQHVAGTRCTTDLAEMPSTLMEYFFYDTRILPILATHHQTKAPLPEGMTARICQSRSAFKALELQQQAVNALFDLKIHSNYDLSSSTSTRLYTELYQDALPSVDCGSASWQHRFGHLVPYGAKYYSYLVARAGASLIWATLFDKDPLSRDAGKLWARAQACGGERPVDALLADILGTTPTPQRLVDALAHETDHDAFWLHHQHHSGRQKTQARGISE